MVKLVLPGQSDYTIRRQFVGGSIFLALLFLLSSIITIWQFSRLTQAVGVLQRAGERSAAAFRVHQDSTELIVAVERLLTVKDAARFDAEVTAELDELKSSHAALVELAQQMGEDQEAYPLMNRVSDRVDSVIGIADTMVRQARDGQWPSVQVRVGVLSRDQKQLALDTNRLVDLATQMEEEAVIQVASTRRSVVFYPAMGAVVSIALVMAVVWQTTQRIVRPIEQLTQGAGRLAAGFLDSRVAVTSNDEVGQLAAAFNQMADYLQASYATLEQRVAERTADLQAAAEVARDTAAARELDDVLNRAVNLIQDRFGFYSVGIFLVDEQGNYAIKSAAGEAGGHVLERGHQFNRGDIGLGNHSELTLPLKVGERIIGALDVQSRQPAVFDENGVTVLQTMADQLAMAIENARLLHEARQAMDDLTQERNMLRATLDALPDLLFEMDICGRVYDYRIPRSGTLHISPDNFLNRTVDEVLPPDVAHTISAALARAAETGLHTGAVYSLQAPAGPGWFELSVAAKGGPGAPDGRFIALVRDITARMRAEQALGQSEERYRTIIENIEDGYYEVDMAGNFTFFNPALSEILGYPQDELKGMNYRVYMDEANARAVFKIFNTVYQTEQSAKTFDWELVRWDGAKRFIETSVSLIKGAGGERLGFRGIVRDITERKRVEQKLCQNAMDLQARNEELDAFAHTVAHDLKAPLGHIIGFARLVEESYSELSGEVLAEHLHTIVRNARKLGNIVDELLLLASLRHIKDLTMAPLNMSRIVAEALQRVAPMIQEQQAEVILPGAWPAALGYDLWIEEVWVNYLSNAAKYGGESSLVELGATEQADGLVRFWVRDTGPGLTPEEQARLFTPIATLEGVRARGHGLGLSIVRRIVERLGGRVGVESIAGAGSTFWFTLPAQPAVNPSVT